MEMVGRNRGISAKEGEAIGKLLTAYTRKADESELGKLIVETTILLSAEIAAGRRQGSPCRRPRLQSGH